MIILKWTDFWKKMYFSFEIGDDDMGEPIQDPIDDPTDDMPGMSLNVISIFD